MTDSARHPVWPILDSKEYGAASVFRPEALIREARRQKGATGDRVPAVCILDPDGDVVRGLRACGGASPHPGWACYHTELFTFTLDGFGEAGIIGCAVGASFAVLVAEQLFASGCEFLVSVTSAGQIAATGPPPYFVLIERALRDEGTSYHYLAPAAFAEAPDPALLARIETALAAAPDIRCVRGAVWTTDAPYRETELAISAAKNQGLLAVEMEAAALYAFGLATQTSIVCFAHVTNSMAQAEGDFEKGEADGMTATLAIVTVAARAWSTQNPDPRGDRIAAR